VWFMAIGVTRSPIQRHSATTHVKTTCGQPGAVVVDEGEIL
jgi:hypothetical protein